MMEVFSGHECSNKKSVLVMDKETGELLCSKCGVVVRERTEAFDLERSEFLSVYKDGNRTGMPGSLAVHDMNLATVISRAGKDASGNPLQPSMGTTFKRLRTWDLRIQIKKPGERNLRQAFMVLDRLRAKLGLGDAVVEKAAYIYRKGMRLARGRSIIELVAASLYFACKDSGATRTLKNIADASQVRKKRVARCYMVLVRDLDLRIPIIDPIKYAGRIANKAHLSERTRRKTIDILKQSEVVEIFSGSHPMAIAAAALYYSCILMQENRTQEEMADAAEITGVTLRKLYRKLEAVLKIKT